MKKFLIVFAFLITSIGAQAQSPMWLLPSVNLDAWYPFCSATDVLDRTFTGYDLLSANITATTDRFGFANKAYSYNGVNSEMHYSTTFPIPMFGIADFTYSCHIYPTAAQDAIILYNGNPTIDGLGIIMNDGTFGGGPGNQVSILFGGVNQSIGFPVTLNQWHHLLLRRNGNSYLLYVDGVRQVVYIPVGLPASGYNPPTTVFQLGLDISSGTKPFAGKIDDIAIYSRQVSDVETSQLQDFNPNIVFEIASAPDTATCDNVIHLGGGIDTLTYPNKTVDPVLGYKYTWNPSSDTTTTFDTTFLSTPQPPINISLKIERMYSCPTTRAVLATHVIPSINIGPDQTVCDGDSVTLNPTPSPGFTHLWSTGDTTGSLLVRTTGIYSVTVDSMTITGSDTTHCYASDEANIVVSPTTYVSLRSDTLLCQGGTVTLSSLDTPYTAPIYEWSDGVTTTPTLDVTATGTYWLKVTDGACSATDTVNITIVYDTVTVVTPDTAICQGATIVATATFSPDITYQWTPTSGIPTSDIATPTITADTSAYYVVTASILSCRAKDSFFLDVQPYPSVSIGGNRNVCKFDTIHITPTVTPRWYTGYSYNWTPPTFLDDGTAPNVVFTAGDTTKLVLTVTTPAGCSGSDSAIIYVYNGNFASMNTDTAICPGDSVVLQPLSTEPGVTYYSWNPPTYLSDPLSANPVIKPINNINYTGIATSQYGCKDTVTYSITVFPAAVVHLEDSVVLFPGDVYEISPSSNCTYYSWTPHVGLSDTGISNPIARPPVSTKYILTAMTEDGCYTVDSIGVRVEDESVISVPNAFIPGSAYNGKLKVILNGIARLRYFRIYNRWGGLVFEGRDIDEGWDGTLNDVVQPMGVYIYEAEAVTEKGKILRKQGNITLLN